jgi:hypothetical protein
MTASRRKCVTNTIISINCRQLEYTSEANARKQREAVVTRPSMEDRGIRRALGASRLGFEEVGARDRCGQSEAAGCGSDIPSAAAALLPGAWIRCNRKIESGERRLNGVVVLQVRGCVVADAAQIIQALVDPDTQGVAILSVVLGLAFARRAVPRHGTGGHRGDGAVLSFREAFLPRGSSHSTAVQSEPRGVNVTIRCLEMSLRSFESDIEKVEAWPLGAMRRAHAIAVESFLSPAHQ